VSSGDVAEKAESKGAHHPAQPPLLRRRTVGEPGIACSPTVVRDTIAHPRWSRRDQGADTPSG